MWPLPNIKSLNAQAKVNAAALDREAVEGGHECECCREPATVHDKYFDIFSEDAKGVRHLCESHAADNPTCDENYFICDACQRLIVDHYTWERYAVRDEETGEQVCLACAAKQYFRDPDNAIDPAKVTKVVQDRNGRCLFDPETGIVNLCKVRHVLGVEQPLPEGVKYKINFENCNERGLFDTDEVLRYIKSFKVPVYLVLDGAYQFSASIGLYVKKAGAISE